MAVYGYCRVSTMQQNVERQIDNVKRYNADTVIFAEKQSAKDIDNRSVFKELLNKVKEGDEIVFDEVSRMSRNADEGYKLYMDLMKKGIELTFLKERHIDTREYKRRSKNQLSRIQTQNNTTDKLINGIIVLFEEFLKDNLKDNIRIAFERAEQERLFLIRRVTEGKAKSTKHQGRPKGSKNLKSEKSENIKKVILELSKDFDGKFTDAKILKEYLPKTARNTYYKYKKELLREKSLV